MTKPDWCPQRVWDDANDCVTEYSGSLDARPRLRLSVARAIPAAEQREREAIDAIIAERAAGEMNMVALSDDEENASVHRKILSELEEVGAAIRNRSQDQ